MNRYKIQDIVNYIRRQGKLPEDQFGNVLGVDDILRWYGLEQLLDTEEALAVKRELFSIIEAQKFMERFELENS